MMKTWTMFLAVLSYDLDRLNITASSKEIVKIRLIWVPLKRTTELICFFVTHLLKVFYWVWNEPHPWSNTGKMVCDWRLVRIYSRPGLKITFKLPLWNIKNSKIFWCFQRVYKCYIWKKWVKQDKNADKYMFKIMNKKWIIVPNVALNVFHVHKKDMPTSIEVVDRRTYLLHW